MLGQYRLWRREPGATEVRTLSCNSLGASRSFGGDAGTSARTILRQTNQALEDAPPIGSADVLLHINQGTADVLTAIQCRHFLTSDGRISALRACHGVLKPGGLFITFENIAPRTPAGVDFGLAAWKSFLMEHGWAEPDAERQVARYGREFLPITVEEHLAALTRTGFSVVEIFWHSQIQAASTHSSKTTFHQPIQIFEFKIYAPLKV